MAVRIGTLAGSVLRALRQRNCTTIAGEEQPCHVELVALLRSLVPSRGRIDSAIPTATRTLETLLEPELVACAPRIRGPDTCL